MTRVLLASIFFLFALPLLAREKTDVLVMKNGDRMTCEVKGLDAGVLYVSVDYIDGTTSVDWSKVARIDSHQLFFVRTEDGNVYSGILSTAENPAGRPVMIKVAEPTSGQNTELARSSVVSMLGTSDRFWQRFNGSVSLGLNYSKGNQATQYNLSSNTAYTRQRWNVAGSFDSNLTSSVGTDASTRNQLNLVGMRLMRWNNWFYSGGGTFLQSEEQGIAMQTTIGGGVGHFLVNTNHAKVAVIGGGAWERTRYDQTTIQQPTNNVGAALIATQASLFRFSKTNLNLDARALPALSEPGRIRFDLNASYFVKIVSDLKWNISFYGSWDNQPPPGFSGSDYGTSSGLTWTFGVK